MQKDEGLFALFSCLKKEKETSMDQNIDTWDISHYNHDEEKDGFELELYAGENGEVPFYEFIKELSPKLKAKVIRDLDVLERFGNELREPYSKPLGQGIFELRTLFGKDITRTLYFFYFGKKIIITHGFVKKQKKTPAGEIKRALKFREDWIRRNGNEIQ